MRTRVRMALVCAIAAIGLTGVVVLPVASATTKPPTTRAQEKRQNKGLKKAAKNISQAKSNISSLSSGLSTAQNQINTLIQLSNQLPPILTQLTDGLTAINTALQNPTTGLVGLNNARPQFGVFDTDGTILGGTGLSGGSGPSADATEGAGILAGMYVVDFGNDVSKRVYSVNVFPQGPGTPAPTASAVNCAASTSYSALCKTVEGAAHPDTSPNHVVVQIGDGTAASPTPFSVTAFSG
jgi:hypothetical protein